VVIPVPPTIQIDSVHCAALCEELGYRLRQHLEKGLSEIPLQLKLLLDRLRQQDGEEAPSIVPSFEDMNLLEDVWS
jgi:hypothetical protein